MARALGAASEEDPRVAKVYLHLYKTFMEEIDAIDNGVQQYDTESPAKYMITTTLSGRVSSLKPNWNEEAGFRK